MDASLYKKPKLKIKSTKTSGYGQKGSPSPDGGGLTTPKEKLKLAPLSQSIKLIPPKKAPGETTYRKAQESTLQRKDAQMFTGEDTEDLLEQERMKRELRLKKKLEGMK